MATLDLVKQYGGKPANFCDVGGGANAEHVATALQIIQGAEKVRTRKRGGEYSNRLD